jgi:hypothetical protein
MRRHGGVKTEPYTSELGTHGAAGLPNLAAEFGEDSVTPVGNWRSIVGSRSPDSYARTLCWNPASVASSGLQRVRKLRRVSRIDARHLLIPQMLYMSSGEAVFFSRQVWRKYLWIMLPMIVTNEVPQRQHGSRSSPASAVKCRRRLARGLGRWRTIAIRL